MAFLMTAAPDLTSSNGGGRDNFTGAGEGAWAFNKDWQDHLKVIHWITLKKKDCAF